VRIWSESSVMDGLGTQGRETQEGGETDVSRVVVAGSG